MRRPIWLLLLALLAPAPVAGAEPWAPGTVVTPFRLADQNDAPHVIDAATRLLLVTHDMDGGALVREALAQLDAATLEARGVAYVADISGMPGLVARLMAIPRMRKRPYPVLLDRDGVATRDVPRAEGKATLVRLDGLRVTDVAQLGTVDEVGHAVAPRP